MFVDIFPYFFLLLIFYVVKSPQNCAKSKTKTIIANEIIMKYISRDVYGWSDWNMLHTASFPGVEVLRRLGTRESYTRGRKWER